MGLFSFLTQEIAIDLGTANTLIIWNDKVVVDEPSIVAKDIQSGKIVAIGRKAQQMHGKTHKLIETIRPLKDGVIADFNSAEQMIFPLFLLLRDAEPHSFFNPFSCFFRVFSVSNTVFFPLYPIRYLPSKRFFYGCWESKRSIANVGKPILSLPSAVGRQ